MKLKKVFALLLAVLFLSVNTGICEEVAEIEIVGNNTPKDYSSAGEETYEIKATKEQIEAREKAKKIYSSEMADKNINIKPMFENWTTKQILSKINNIGMKIVVANELDDFVRFSVSRKEVVNATSSYRGEIKVYRGLLNYVETEDELAYVLGHELGHIYKKDSRTKMIRRGIMLGALATGIVLASAGEGATRKTGTGVILASSGAMLAEPKFTKWQEERADINGIDFMVKAGYNPLAAISMMNKILDRTWDILSDHPSGDKRMIAAYNYIEQNYPMYLDGGYDTISYERALKYILARKAKKAERKAKKDTKKADKNAAAKNKNSKKEFINNTEKTEPELKTESEDI